MNSPRRMAAGALVLGGLVVSTALLSRPAPAFQALSGFDLFRSQCDGCHELPDPDDPMRTREQWETILTRMVKERGAVLNDKEFKAVLSYLDSFNRPPREIQWNDTPAKSHKVTFAAADAGKLPATWVDLTVGGEETVPWSVQEDSGSKGLYLAPLRPAGANQFPILVDNTGVVQNGGASTRLQLVSGKGAPAAGIVFGFKNPQSYYGVLLTPANAILYEVQRGQRALLARAPLAVPLKQWHTLAVETTGKAVKVSVNGKPVDALSRSLGSYQGGRLGVHTQADTVALFDQWQVTAR